MASSVKFNKDHNILNIDRREKIGHFLTNFTKFAIDSAVNVSFKGVTSGKRVYKIVQEGLKNQPCSFSVDDKKKHNDIESEEKMQANMGEMQEVMNNLKKQNKTSVKLAESSKPQKKIPNEGIKGWDILKTNEKRIFIRPRL